MKKLIYILLAASLLASSCAREDVAPVEVEVTEDAKVPIILAFQQPVTLTAQTKANEGMGMGFNPAIRNIHVAVFGSSGYLQEYVSATPCDASGRAVSGFANANATTAYFLVRLSVRTKQSQVHVIANGPASLSYNAYETTLMQGLRTTDGNGAYWTRINLPHGIQAKMETNDEGEEVYMEDDYGELIATDETRAAFNNLVLIRNFAGITVRERTDVEGGVPNFDLVGFTVCNMPAEGSVAMYSSTHDEWVTDYEEKCIITDDPAVDGFYQGTGLIKWNGIVYPGFPTTPILNTDDIPETEAQFNAAGVAVGPGETKFIYERAVSSSAAPFVLLAGRYLKEGTPTSETPIQYYRPDITKNDRYVPFYRNINYFITLTGVSVEGYDTPEEAAKHNSGDNFSVSLDTSTLPDVSNGTVRMLVEKTAIDLLYTSEQQDVWFEFSTTTDPAVYLNEDVEITEEEGGNAITLGTTTYSGDKGYIHFTLNQPSGQQMLTSVLKLVGSYTDNGSTSKLSREIVIRTFNKQEMTLSLAPETVAPLVGEETTMSIAIPKTLTWSMFPMEFLIEDSAKSLNPSSGTIPVRTGVNSIITGQTSVPSYYFVYTLNWSDYTNLLTAAERAGDTGSTVSFDVVMKSIKATNATTIYVANNYFNTANVALSNDATNMITPSSQTISGTSATVEITSSGAWALSIARTNGSAASGVTLSEYSGSTSVSGRAITVTLPVNNGGNPISYTLTLTNTADNITRKAIILQNGVTVEMDYYNNTKTIAAAGGTFYVNVTSEVDYTLSIIDSDENVIGTPVNGTANGSTTRMAVTVPANDLITDRNITIRLSNGTGSITRDLTVTQYASTAEMYIVDTDIYAQEAYSTINIVSTIATVLKLYGPNGDLISSTDMAAASGGRDYELALSTNTTGSSRLFTVNLCNTSGKVLRTGNITQYGPSLRLTTSNSSVAYNATSATVNVYSDMDWTLSVSGGSGTASLSRTSGSATASTNVTLTMPANTNREEKPTYTVTLQSSDGTILREVTVTQGYAPYDISVAYNRSNVSSGTYSYSSSPMSITVSDVTASNNYLTTSRGSEITVSVESGYTIKSIIFTRSYNRWAAAYDGSDGGIVIGNNTDVWTATSTSGVTSVEFTIGTSIRSNSYYRITNIEVVFVKED